MPLSKDLREFVELLNSNAVEYLVVGGFAVAFHGFARYTADLDFLIRAGEENAHRMLNVLSQFGFGSLAIRAEDLQSPGKIIQLGVKPNRIDILTSISGVTFDEACCARTQGLLEGVATQYSLPGLLIWLGDREYGSIRQMQGSLSRNAVPQPEAFEHANYMKVLSSYAMR